jgi:hypothetical protein
LAYANGIACLGGKVWVACTFKKDLVEYERNADGTLNVVRKLSGINVWTILQLPEISWQLQRMYHS